MSNTENILSKIAYSNHPFCETTAKALAEKLHLTALPLTSAEDDTELMLRMDEDGLALVKEKHALRGDFHQMLSRLKKANLQHEFLVKAAKLKGLEGTPVAVDATAGMGDDSLLLAAAGYEVYLFEYDPIIAALLQDTLRRAAEDEDLCEIAGRMHLIEGNSIEQMPNLSFLPDIVLLDPMFPARQKSALVKKKFQLLQQLESPCCEEEDLLNAALAAHPRKVIIKRPVKGPFLAGRKPDYSMAGKAIRYDCILLPR